MRTPDSRSVQDVFDVIIANDSIYKNYLNNSLHYFGYRICIFGGENPKSQAPNLRQILMGLSQNYSITNRNNTLEPLESLTTMPQFTFILLIHTFITRGQTFLSTSLNISSVLCAPFSMSDEMCSNVL